MIISAIAAIGPHRALGWKQQMAWNYPSEYRHFLDRVKGRHILMGGVNWLSNEHNTELLTQTYPLVLSRSLIPVVPTIQQYGVPGIHSNLELLLDLARRRGEQELFVIGGAQIYSLMMPETQRLYLSHVPYEGPADCFFPPFEHLAWQVQQGQVVTCSGEEGPSWRWYLLNKKN